MLDDEWLGALRRFRMEYHLTQRELAIFLGVNQKTVSRWERGIDHPNPETRDRLHMLLDESNCDGLPVVYEAVRDSPIPIALVDGNGNILVASRTFGGVQPKRDAPPVNIGSPPTILVIEDDTSVLKATRAVLKRWHFLSIGATDGDAAVQMVADGSVRPTAAIIDFLLPGGMDGVETAAALRQSLPNLPILIVSGETTPERMDKISASGLPFIRKPVDPFKIRTVLLAMFGQGNNAH